MRKLYLYGQVKNTVILKPGTNLFFRRKHGAIGRTRIYMNCFQKEYISGQIPLFSDTVKIFTGKRRGKLRQYKKLGKVELFFDKLIISSEKTNYTFPISDISGMNIQNNNKFEFYYNNTLYRFKFTTQHKSVYKYELAIKIINKINSQQQS